MSLGPKCGAYPLAKGFQCATVPKASPLARSRKGPATFSRLHLVKLCWHQKSSATPGCEPSLLRAVLHFDVHWLIASASDWICGSRLRTPGTLAAELRPISQDILKMTPYKSKGHDDDSFQDIPGVLAGLKFWIPEHNLKPMNSVNLDQTGCPTKSIKKLSSFMIFPGLLKYLNLCNLATYFPITTNRQQQRQITIPSHQWFRVLFHNDILQQLSHQTPPPE